MSYLFRRATGGRRQTQHTANQAIRQTWKGSGTFLLAFGRVKQFVNSYGFFAQMLASSQSFAITTMAEPTEKLNYLDKQAETHADHDPLVFELNQKVVSLLPEFPAGSHVLDFGCGAGHISLLVAKNDKVASVIGTDVSSGMIAKCEKNDRSACETVRNKVTRMQTSRSPRDELGPMKGQKDLVIMSFVLGHISPKAAGTNVVHTVAETLKPGGQFALAEMLFTAGEEGGRSHHDHSHTHDHGHNHSHGHEHGGDGETSHHEGHVAYTEDDLRKLFRDCGLQPKADFEQFDFNWNGNLVRCIMAVGTKS